MLQASCGSVTLPTPSTADVPSGHHLGRPPSILQPATSTFTVCQKAFPCHLSQVGRKQRMPFDGSAWKRWEEDPDRLGFERQREWRDRICGSVCGGREEALK